MFSPNSYRNEFKLYLSGIDICNISNYDFVSVFVDILDLYAPLKQKYIRANDGPFITKELETNTSRLRNQFYKDKSAFSSLAYKCVSLLRKTKKNFYGNLNPSIICDNKTFWKIVKPLFSEVATTQNITLIERNAVIDDDKLISESLNDFFSNAVASLNIETIIFLKMTLFWKL